METVTAPQLVPELPALSHPLFAEMEPEHVREFESIRLAVVQHSPDSDLGLLERAFLFSYRAHQGQRRISGEPYIIHGIAVARILADLNLGDTTVAAGFLHDVVEDTEITVDNIRKDFGDAVANLVDGVTKIPELKYESQEKKQAENFHKMLLSMSQDLRVILIKFADRLHNMRTIGYLPRKTQERIAHETLDVYAPLAHRLGVHQIKWELEDLAFKVLEPRTYKELAEKVQMKRGEREHLVQDVTASIEAELKSGGIQARVTGRAKHLYSIFNKIRNRGYNFEEILDLIAVRVIVPRLEDCYHALGVIHSLYTPIEGKFADFVATPKSNMYQSLHTKVFGPEGRKIEVQIRTELMHRTSEIGIAAHWRYKEGGASREELDRQMEWLRSVLESRDEATSSGEFLQNLKINLFQEEIFVFTPRGRLLTLPRGATPVDFAFAVHTDIGLHAMAAKVNGQITPLKGELNSGDVVEIIVSPSQKPNPDWLQFVRTSRAQSKIKKWLKEQHFEESARLGREILLREFQKFHIKKTDKELADIALLFGQSDLESFMAAVGAGDVSIQSVLRKALPVEEDQGQGWGSILSKVIRRVKGSESGVRIHGMQNVAITFGRCCQPLPGDRITGFITTGRGVSVHRVDCRNIPVLMQRPERNIAVEWDVDREATFNVRVRVIAKERLRLLSELTQAMAKDEVNILYLEMKKEDAFAVGNLTLEVKSLPHLTRVFKRMKAIKDVIHVERLDEDGSHDR
ncbi:bifunctional (p)ppGpp synthetase/guanosine-3',5'-bis(diphosphate) 3'-pyrophosphohydrolase [candidate division KSB1 bacterium]|nr:MAG: bifunctional (p)ppGpp synthetase/guanosine-3',5'-bis(diphosphate) 3'-pyrophosphohydrolase [candidate division KSB1 bacterium]